MNTSLRTESPAIKEFTLHDYFHVIRKRYLVVLGVMFVGTLFTLIFSLRQKPTYRASGSIEVRTSQSYYQTESIRLLAFSLNTYSKVITSDELIREAIATTGSTMTPAEVMAGLKVSQEPGTFIINISLNGQDPGATAATLNGLMEALVSRTRKEHNQKIEEAVDNIRDQMRAIESNLRNSERELKDFEAERGIPGEKRRYDEIQGNIRDLSRQLYQASMEREQTALTIKAMQNRVRRASGLTVEAVGTGEGMAQITAEMEKMLSELSLQKQRLLKIYKSSHPKILEIEQRIDNLRRGEGEAGSRSTESYAQRMDKLRFDMAALEIRERTLQSLIESEKQKLADAPDEDLEYVRLKRKLETAQKIYDSLVGKYSEVNVVQSSLKAVAAIVEKAAVPSRPEYSRISYSLIMSLISSFVMGIAFTFLIEHLDNSIKNHEEAESLLGLQVMGLIPEIHPASQKKGIGDGTIYDYMDPKLVTMHDPMSIGAESFNSFRINVKFALGDNPQKTMIITSPIREAGKTLVACNLAVSYARSGLKTLLVDVDLRKPMVHYMFNTDNIKGLTNFFMDQVAVEDIVVGSGIRNLDLVTSGLLPDNPVELLDSRIFDKIISTLASRYDHVIFDCPPLLGFPDSLLIASKMDVVLYLVSLRNTKSQQARAGIKLLANADANVVGILCNRVKKDELGGYYYRYS